MPAIEFEDQPFAAAPPARALPPPTAPSRGRRFEEIILPSGRAARLRVITTKDYLGAKERAAATAGDPAKAPDPRGVRFAGALDRELLALALVAHTEALDWSEPIAVQQEMQLRAWEEATKGIDVDARPDFAFTPDADALLASLPETAWTPTTPLLLLTPGALSLEEVFNEIADWGVLTSCTGRMLLPKRDLSGIVGKVRTVVR